MENTQGGARELIVHWDPNEVTVQFSIFNRRTKHPEFRSFRWIAPNDSCLDWLPKFKHGVYRAVLRDFFGVTFPSADEADMKRER